ncbi:MAG TPA: TetR/AcrR family transcriptional regulator [Acidobacteriaceae bacterium]|jgi:AcrR family transcriptional regulator|nr:TetR/AcrR family transcriptional regulator [Acidobacteriaceae bacterium]
MNAHDDRKQNLAWGKKPPPGRGPKPTLSTIKIAHAAIAIADTQGLEAITMQRVAKDVGVTTMALYRYFSRKADLVDLMIDSVSESAPDFGNRRLKWDSRLKNWAHRCLALYRSHPWFLEATSARHTVMGPNELLWMEAALSMLAEAGLSPEERISAFFTVIAHVRGHATFQQTEKSEAPTQDWSRDLAQLLAQEPTRYPSLRKALNSSNFFKGSAKAFDFGLECILEGIKTRAKRRRTHSN